MFCFPQAKHIKWGDNTSNFDINIGDYAIPVIFAAVCLYGLIKRTDIFSEFIKGAEEGLHTVKDIFPSLMALVVSVGMFSNCGGVDFLSRLLSPVTELFGFPGECTPLAILRPFSGSGATAIFESILTANGADSFAGRVASVMLGSSETTFYTLAVYFGATKVKNTRYALAAALVGDLCGWFLSGWAVRLFFGG